MPTKRVFITVGTTAFDELIQTILNEDVLKALSLRGYNELILQIGKTSMIPDCTPRCGFSSISYFNLDAAIAKFVHSADLIISHAGAGSILDALDAKKYLIVVTNQKLMNNHQLELAEQLYTDGHLYYCSCESLLNLIETMDLTKLKPFVNDKSKKIASYIDKIMGFN